MPKPTATISTAKNKPESPSVMKTQQLQNDLVGSPHNTTDTHSQTGDAIGCANWRDWLRKMDECAEETGFTTFVVNRCGSTVVTIDKRYGDRALARRNGRLGPYVASNLRHGGF